MILLFLPHLYAPKADLPRRSPSWASSAAERRGSASAMPRNERPSRSWLCLLMRIAVCSDHPQSLITSVSIIDEVSSKHKHEDQGAQLYPDLLIIILVGVIDLLPLPTRPESAKSSMHAANVQLRISDNAEENNACPECMATPAGKSLTYLPKPPLSSRMMPPCRRSFAAALMRRCSAAARCVSFGTMSSSSCKQSAAHG